MIGAGLVAKKAVERGLEGAALGEDLARAGQPGGDRLSGQGRARQISRQARLQSRRLWLHDLHRQFGPAAGSRRQCRDRRRSRHLFGAVGQPQFRGPRPSAGARQLSRLADAGGGLCAGRFDEHQPDAGAGRLRQRERAGLSEGHLALARRKSPTPSANRSRRRASARATATCSTARRPGARSRSRRARPMPGTRPRPM